jgi:hypothetical protein
MKCHLLNPLIPSEGRSEHSRMGRGIPHQFL